MHRAAKIVPVMLILGLGLGLRDLGLAKKLSPKVLWDYKSHLGFNCRRILFSELYFKIRVPYILTYLQWTRVVVLDGTVPYQLQVYLWDGLGNVALALALTLALSGPALLTSLDCSSVVSLYRVIVWCIIAGVCCGEVLVCVRLQVQVHS